MYKGQDNARLAGIPLNGLTNKGAEGPGQKHRSQDHGQAHTISKRIDKEWSNRAVTRGSHAVREGCEGIAAIPFWKSKRGPWINRIPLRQAPRWARQRRLSLFRMKSQSVGYFGRRGGRILSEAKGNGRTV
jgi:hypothetical protein